MVVSQQQVVHLRLKAVLLLVVEVHLPLVHPLITPIPHQDHQPL